jgi:hypothetical protein
MRGLLVAVLAVLAVSLLPESGVSGWQGALYQLALGGAVYAAAVLVFARWLGGAAVREGLSRVWRRVRRRGAAT